MIDLMHLSHNRLEFTKTSLAALEANTDWSLVGQFLVYDDDSTDGTREFLEDWIAKAKARIPSEIVARFDTFEHPVNAMRDYLKHLRRHSIFGKIDSDTMVPPGWLGQCFDVMERKPELDLLGIEAMNPVDAAARERGYTKARFIGGIGLMRVSAFRTLPEPNGPYFGFTEWQERNPQVHKGWLNPSLPVFLLDRFPFEPWRSRSKEYVHRFGQRDWGPYNEKSSDLWSWWYAQEEPVA